MHKDIAEKITLKSGHYQTALLQCKKIKQLKHYANYLLLVDNIGDYLWDRPYVVSATIFHPCYIFGFYSSFVTPNNVVKQVEPFLHKEETEINCCSWKKNVDIYILHSLFVNYLHLINSFFWFVKRQLSDVTSWTSLTDMYNSTLKRKFLFT